jgi:hypothetical protein
LKDGKKVIILNKSIVAKIEEKPSKNSGKNKN